MFQFFLFSGKVLVLIYLSDFFYFHQMVRWNINIQKKANSLLFPFYFFAFGCLSVQAWSFDRDFSDLFVSSNPEGIIIIIIIDCSGDRNYLNNITALFLNVDNRD